MAYSKINIRELYERHLTGRSGLYDKVKVVSRCPAACCSEEHVHGQYAQGSICDAQDYGEAEEQRVCPTERLQGTAPQNMMTEAPYLYNRHYDSPAGQQMDLRSCGIRSSLPCEHYSPYRSASIHKQNQKLFPDNIPVHPNTSTEQPEKRRPPKDLSGGLEDGSPHASAAANKMFSSGLDENPDLGREHAQTPEERCARAITAKALEIEKLYTQDCKTFGLVVKMLISKDQSLERQLLSALKKNLVDIRKQSLKDLRQFISDVTVPLTLEQSAKLYRNITKRRFRRPQHI